MSIANIEHANITVPDPLATAGTLVDLFDWHIRWQGEASNEGFTVHVGGDDSYLALYTRGTNSIGSAVDTKDSSYDQPLMLNHIGIVVDDLESVESRVKKAGFKTHSYADYEPGRRFYFHDNDGLEFEVISYR